METMRKCNRAKTCKITDCWAREEHMCHPVNPRNKPIECRTTGWWVKCEPIKTN